MEGPMSEVKRFALEEGTRVKIMEKTAAWTRLRDSEGRDGWVPTKALGAI
jgi:SH3-like domain-containing protein